MGKKTSTRRLLSGACVVVWSACATGIASADLGLFYLPEQEQEWQDALSEYTIYRAFRLELDRLDDFGVRPFDGPLTTEGNDFIPAGFVPHNELFDSNIDPYGGDGLNGRGKGGKGLLALGPSAGFGNPSNAILANHAQDSFDHYFHFDDMVAVDLVLTSIGGGSSVDLTIETRLQGEMTTYQIFDVPASAKGRRVGLLVRPERGFELLTRINIYDPGGGQEGFQGKMDIYALHPAPGALGLFAIAGVARRRRRW